MRQLRLLRRRQSMAAGSGGFSRRAGARGNSGGHAGRGMQWCPNRGAAVVVCGARRVLLPEERAQDGVRQRRPIEAEKIKSLAAVCGEISEHGPTGSLHQNRESRKRPARRPPSFLIPFLRELGATRCGERKRSGFAACSARWRGGCGDVGGRWGHVTGGSGLAQHFQGAWLRRVGRRVGNV